MEKTSADLGSLQDPTQELVDSPLSAIELARREILTHAGRDFASQRRRPFTVGQLERLVEAAAFRLDQSIAEREVVDIADLQSRWNTIVSGFYETGFEGYTDDVPERPRVVAEPPHPSKELVPFLRTFFVPVFINKSILFFFGVQYSRYPGQGYGYGLVFMILFTLSSFVYFCWKESGKPESVS